MHRNENYSGRQISLCFDDALITQKNLVEELGICATFAVPTELVGSSSRHLSWDDLRELQENGHEISCHSHRHNEWGEEGYDIDDDIRTSVKLLSENGIEAKSFVPPRNNWIESEVVREHFSFGRKGDGNLLADKMRIKACGLSRLKREEIDYALNFNKPRNWAVFIAHLYKDDGIPDERFGDEWFVIRDLVSQLKNEGCHFVKLSEVGEEFQKELDAIYRECQLCGGSNFSSSVQTKMGVVKRPNAKCKGCGSLERHRDLAFLIDYSHILVSGKSCLLVSSGELLNCLQRNGASVRIISQFQDEPYNDVSNLSEFEDESVDVIILQHVLPHVSNHVQALGEMRRVLKVDGVIYAQHPVNMQDQHQPYSISRNVFSESLWLSEVEESRLVVYRFPMLPMDDMFVLSRA